jgi:threonylcarbamoyladenosine tRNA methylthiotransferase MtaB
MRIYLETLGCRLNYAEMTSLGRQLAGAGHEVAASAEEADLCVLNSCAVTCEAARKSRRLVRQLARANPAARLVVTGCYATLEGEAVTDLPNVELVVGNPRKDDLFALMHGLDGGTATALAAARTPAARPQSTTGNGSRTRAFVKVQDGCHNRCTFCIVTVARGDERSRSIAEVVAEVNGLHGEGYQEAVLTGVHLGAYGLDAATDLRALVTALLADTTIPRLRLSSLEPFDLEPDFFDLWSQGAGRLMPHLHLPAQSGSDAILRRMARRNRVAEFEALVTAARARIPGLTVTTDLIAGFPGETEPDFAQTLAFAGRVGFAHIHAFPYSARSGTAAAHFSEQVPEAERRRRSRTLNALDVELGRIVRQQFLGQTRPVLWESPVNAPPRLGEDIGVLPEDCQAWEGLTDNYLRALALAPAGQDLRNRISQTRLVRLAGDALWGEIRRDLSEERTQ